MTKRTKKPGKITKAGAVELTEERLDAASGGYTYTKITFGDLPPLMPPPPRLKA